jgi:hypothetical protein
MIPMPCSALLPKASKQHCEMANKLVQPCGTRHRNHPITHKSNFKLKHVSRGTGKFNAEYTSTFGPLSGINRGVALSKRTIRMICFDD